MSSSSTAISAKGLGKRYALGSHRGYKTIRESIVGLGSRVRGFLESPLDRTRSQAPTRWALREVDFDIEVGETVGILGRNGAGKSTLLKILSRVTEPSAGFVDIRGRVGSLLEIGTGFHPELTGRENLMLRGAVVGMKRREILSKFEQIVAFAELEEFLDTPLKHYSTGMSVRLAFSVAVHLDPEILLLDEILTVGDLGFQKKCVRKLEEKSYRGRTLLFVSHQLGAIGRLCRRCIWLDDGRVRMVGPTAETVAAYREELSGRRMTARRHATTDHKAMFESWTLHESPTEADNHLTTSEAFALELSLVIHRHIRHANHGLVLFDQRGQMVWAWRTAGLSFDPGRAVIRYEIPGLPLKPGVYNFRVSLYEDTRPIDVWNAVPDLVVSTPPLDGQSDDWTGLLQIPCAVRTMDATP